ncbi:tRNA lysidine(34) synthetase TilS [candidate division WOR-3 bacterium]|nr:tRNA lysidine(34) synthetase TilS [candidate division WOR-3 bacterium]
MIKRIKKVIKERELLKGVHKIIIGYSGGPDSTLLAEVLSDYDELEVILAYFNHNLRKDSKKEENFVIREAKKRNLKLLIDGADVRGYCNEFSLSIEEGARKLRLSYLKSVKNKEKADLIALGHNFDDKIENFFIRLLRGSGFGLSQMSYLDGDILRLLISLRKNEIIDYLKENRIAFYIDPTNKSEDYLRNKVRLKVIPLLEQIHENSIENIRRSIDNLSDIEEALYALIDSIKITCHFNYAEIDRDDFDNLPSACKFLILKRMLSIFNSDLELKRAHLTNLPERGIVKLKSVNLELTPYKVIVAKNMAEKEKELPLSGKVPYGYYNIETEVVSPPVKLKTRGCEFFDIDRLELPLKVGRKKLGDRLVTFGAENSKKIKDIFIDYKIPRVLRDIYPIVYDKRGVILIPGIKRSNRAPVLKKTKKVLKIRYNEVTNAGEKR